MSAAVHLEAIGVHVDQEVDNGLIAELHAGGVGLVLDEVRVPEHALEDRGLEGQDGLVHLVLLPAGGDQGEVREVLSGLQEPEPSLGVLGCGGTGNMLGVLDFLACGTSSLILLLGFRSLGMLF